MPIKNRKNEQGNFDLSEFFVITAVVAVLSGIVIVASNPMSQFNEAQQIEQRAAVTATLNDLYEDSLQQNGTLPEGVLSQAELCVDQGTCSQVTLEQKWYE